MGLLDFFPLICHIGVKEIAVSGKITYMDVLCKLQSVVHIYGGTESGPQACGYRRGHTDVNTGRNLEPVSSPRCVKGRKSRRRVENQGELER